MQIEKDTIMRTYNITLNDNLVERARPDISADTDISQWMQRQMETLLIQLTVTSQHEDRQYAPDLGTILAMPLLDKGKGTLVTKRLKAGWSIDYLFSLLEICSVCPDYSIKKVVMLGKIVLLQIETNKED